MPDRSIAPSPGRVNLIGEHTDYDQGLVLPLAMNSVLCAKTIALLLVILAWYRLYQFRNDLTAAISAKHVDRRMKARLRD